MTNIFDDAKGSASTIDNCYTIFTRIPVYRTPDLKIHTYQLWAIDLHQHQKYITHLQLCCPIIDCSMKPDGTEEISVASHAITSIPDNRGCLSVFRNIVPTFRRVRKAVKQSQIVHGGLAGWPFSLDYYILLMRPFSPFVWIINMESSFWMKRRDKRPSPRQWLGHHVNLALGRTCMRLADARMFTQEWYRQQMIGGDRTRSLVNEASWVRDADLITDAEFTTKQIAADGTVRLLLPTRLTPEKGILTFIDAIKELDRRSEEVATTGNLAIHIIGSGPLEAELQSFIASRKSDHIEVSLLPPVPYGSEFFALLRRYDAVIVPIITEEQPRIIYDAFSQGVGCIASATSGILQVVKNGETANLFEPGSSRQLADKIAEAMESPLGLRDLGENALAYARNHTHEAMHRKRALFLQSILASVRASFTRPNSTLPDEKLELT